VQIVDEITLGVALGLVALLGAARLWECLRSDRVLTPRDPREASTISLATLFHQRVSDFRNHVKTLDEHSNEYVAVFTGNEWNSLTETLERLTALDAEVQQHIGSNNLPHAHTILSSLYARQEAPSVTAQNSLPAAEWEESMRVLLRKVVQNLETATHETKRLQHTPSARRRQPTLVTLADVKKALIEDEVISRDALRK
jgi:hypothetical protein